ncbi:MAG: hypothetical protein IJC70_07270, partial [Firmicutes bacterium]|nr:hypothetical protein [Bacillota bacterium]
EQAAEFFHVRDTSVKLLQDIVLNLIISLLYSKNLQDIQIFGIIKASAAAEALRLPVGGLLGAYWGGSMMKLLP